MRAREPLSDDPLAAIEDRQGAIEMGVEVDTQPGEAAAGWAGRELEEAALQLDGVIVLDRAPVFAAADPLEVGGGGPPGRRGGRGRSGHCSGGETERARGWPG